VAANVSRLSLHVEECVPVGEHFVLATFRLAGEEPRARSGWSPPSSFSLGRYADGQVIWVGMFSNESEALEAAGLSE
jgi:hypothetical protein